MEQRTKTDNRNGQQPPQEAIQDAYLTAELQLSVRIIPYLHLQTEIEHKTAQKLTYRDDNTADTAFDKHGAVLNTAEDPVQYGKAYPSGQYH